MKIKIYYILFFYLPFTLCLNAQSFYLTKENEKIFSDEVYEGPFSSQSKLKFKEEGGYISFENIQGKYDDKQDVFFFLKKYKSKSILNKKNVIRYLLMAQIT
ncbi:hypothetical protein GCM10009430_30640 [Aquimarina litoralis]|uniref:Uncharacterized protein n=1 Tax=Aquimarina litoralis TaxID=584605 RepID=A0ABP3UAN0_9FLAO